MQVLEACENKAPATDEGAPMFKAVIIDAAGILLEPAEPVEETYKRLGLRFNRCPKFVGLKPEHSGETDYEEQDQEQSVLEKLRQQFHPHEIKHAPHPIHPPLYQSLHDAREYWSKVLTSTACLGHWTTPRSSMTSTSTW